MTIKGGSGRVSRRGFFGASAAAYAGIAGGGGLFQALVARDAFARGGGVRQRGAGYGSLEPAGSDLLLPPGFRYAVVSEEGQIMNDGFPVPKAMDGMSAFSLPNGNIRLIRNHEDREDVSRVRPRPADSTSTNAGILSQMLATHFGPRAAAYDAWATGGCTSLELEPRGHRRLVGQHWSLVGTTSNCAGGPAPWGSWLSCEETTAAASSTGLGMDHGYVFEVPVGTSAGNPALATPLKGLGRFNHEAVAVDPATGNIYETEDNGEIGGFYRWVPDGGIIPTAPGQLAALTGSLYMLKISSSPEYNTAVGQTVGVALPCEWVPIATPDAGPTAAAVYNQGILLGGARFRKLEGCWYANGNVYFQCSTGGAMASGQYWVYDIAAGTLTLLFESPGVDVLDQPDNMCVSPRGGIVVAEDGDTGQFLRGLSADGTQIFDFAKNIRNTFEFAGVCFSPDGNTMFANIIGRSSCRTVQPNDVNTVRIPVEPEQYQRACTLAIWGHWRSGLL
ncbi:MAG TPA: alkaline phosphatase PhoX [Polyangiaceae bacterium]|nr:alkaline phosphatase PhoX [Polyangiaceae bacterium]